MSGNRKRIVLIAALVVFLLLEGIGYYLGGKRGVSGGGSGTDNNNTGKTLASKMEKNAVLRRRLASLAPKGVYIVIDTARNVLYLKKGEQVIVQAVVSSGSGNMLIEPSGKRTWVFDTPRGEYAIRSKIVNPDWIKPDWAFIEEGETIPGKLNDRIESGTLGDYALAFGNGYFIHGTLYTRMLGRNVTHGCIRVGDKDLENIYKNTPLGTKLFIF